MLLDIGCAWSTETEIYIGIWGDDDVVQIKGSMLLKMQQYDAVGYAVELHRTGTTPSPFWKSQSHLSDIDVLLTCLIVHRVVRCL